ncbi:SDR family NAD(P)-dependent oxidoreductase [Nitrosomonas sp. JL21]|uniref:SDR family oxidoreductase n=1 Tax=Nitrosomonas sp. JL21 TaxID=153949 RepID=UPI00136B6CE4|nr:SDR family oxidoreductase [Nitrosomonas sp. JL21]MBL8497441.1 SDR family oxidoreductase [Nitrosomonas sp.]MCC7090884.1 SDR family oxidoreductase [Nitrosomonas sp.]MXS78676.1 SDR family NAD(P)-dependent oxidoreductase [Nitrosomonas sp. JL21]
MEKNPKKQVRPQQHQSRPGSEDELNPPAETKPKHYAPSGKLAGKVCLITGGDSGIGKAASLLFAKEGADIAIAYLSETDDAAKTKQEIEAFGKSCLLIKADLSEEANCKTAIEKTIEHFGQLDILINNAALHWEAESLSDISTEQLMTTFSSNFFSCFWLSKYALPHLKKGSCIINTTSVTAYRGSPHLIDYSSTKGAIVTFTRSLALNLIDKGIRVNAVAPGPIWTPLIASSFDPEKVAAFGSDSPMKRAGMPNEVAPCFLFLASEDASYMTGQVLHPNGGEVING